MKLFHVQVKPFTGTSTDYVTKEAVERANARLIARSASTEMLVGEVYARYQVTRPSQEEIAKAGAKALGGTTASAVHS
jgi:hypothetical protein